MTAAFSAVDGKHCYLPGQIRQRGQGCVLQLEPGALSLRANIFAA